MIEPGFSESQLQQAANISFSMKIGRRHGRPPYFYVPSLLAEFNLGWDTGFFLPWFPYAPRESDHGCNFFVQYKLSVVLTSSGAKEWSHWGEEYFRFKIPHSRRNSTGTFVDDYHQWHRLKALADLSFPTFYATNALCDKDEFMREFEAGNVLDHVPLLDVRGVANEHKYVTFTANSGAFALHSELEESNRRSFSDVLRSLPDEEEQTTIAQAITRVERAVIEIGAKDEAWTRDLERLREDLNTPMPQELKPWIKFSLLAAFLRKHIGVAMYWLQKAA